MKNLFKGASFYSIIVVLFCLSAVFCNDEKTADPGIVYVGSIMLPSIIYFIFSKQRLNTRICVLAGCIVCSATISIFLVGEPFTSTTLKYFLFLFFYVVISSVKFTNENIHFIFKILAIVSVFLSCAIIASFLTGQTYYDDGRFRFSLNSLGLDKNPNYVTSFINISFFTLFYSIITGNLRTNKKIIILLSLIIMFSSFCMTGTRAALLTVAITLTSSFFFIKQNKSLIKYLIFATLILLVIIAHYWGQIQDFSELFLQGRTMTDDDNRSETWAMVLYAFFNENPVFGFGPSVAADIGTKYGTMDYLHNIYLEIMVGHGLFGLFLYFLLLSAGWHTVNKKDKRFLLFFLIISGFPLMFQNGFMAVNFWRFAILNRILVNNSSKSNQTRNIISQIG